MPNPKSPNVILQKLRELDVGRRENPNKVPITWQTPSRSEMSYYNRGESVPDIGLGEAMGPVETFTTLKQLGSLAKLLTKKTVAKAPFLLPKKVVNRGGMEILKFRTNPVIDIDKINNARHIGGGGIHITRGQAERTVEELERAWGGPWELYETPGGYRAIYTGKRRARPVDFFGDENVSQILNGVVDPDYVKYSQANGSYGVRISPKRMITEHPLTRPLRSGDPIPDDYIARKIRTVGDPKKADRRMKMVLKYMHDKPIQKYNAGKKTVPPHDYTLPTEDVLRERTLRSSNVMTGERKIAAEIDNINARGGITEGEERMFDQYINGYPSDEEAAIVTNILQRRTGATEDAIDNMLINDPSRIENIRAIRARNEEQFLGNRARVTNYGQQNTLQKVAKTEDQFMYSPRDRSDLDNFAEGSYGEENILNDRVTERLPGITRRRPTVRSASTPNFNKRDLGYYDVKKMLGKEPTTKSVLDLAENLKYGQKVTMSLPGKSKRVIKITNEYGSKFYKIEDTLSKEGTKASISFSKYTYRGGTTELSNFLMKSSKEGDNVVPVRMLAELPDILPKADRIDFGSLSTDSFPILVKGLKKEMKMNPSRWKFYGYKNWQHVNDMGEKSRLSKNYRWLIDKIIKEDAKTSDLVNTEAYRQISKYINELNKEIGTEVMRITPKDGIMFRGPEVGKILPAVLTYFGIRATEEKGKKK